METIHLTLMEAKLLVHLIENAGTAVPRKTILEEVWDLKRRMDTRAIDNLSCAAAAVFWKTRPKRGDSANRTRRRFVIDN